MKYVSGTIAVALFLSLTAFAQTSGNTQPAPDNYVTEKDFKSKVFDVKFRDPNSLAIVLSKLGSGFKGATISPSNEFKTLTVRDFPENLVVIEEALKRLDTPMAPRPNIDLHMYVLIASNNGSAGTDAPAELKDVLTELRGTLSFKNYDLAASVVQRLTETSNTLQGTGTADVPAVNSSSPITAMSYAYYLHSVSLVPNSVGAASIQIGEFSFSANGGENAGIKTALNLRDGEKVVVGTAAIRSRALVVVLTARLVK
jgi:type II secretory pathway component GspD/PulD (secretin)